MQPTSNIRRLALIGLAAITGAFGVAHASPAPRASAPRPRTPTPIVETVASQTPSVSADGRFVAYAGAPLAKGDTRSSTALLRDRQADTILELSPAVDGIHPGATVWPVISADGCTVTVITEMALDLFRDDDSGDRWDVYRTVLPHCDGDGDWELVSASSGSGFSAAAGDDVSPLYPPAVSGEGSIVAYTHSFSPLTDDLTGITLVDLTVPIGDTGRSRPVAGSPAAEPDTAFLYRGLRQPALSTDGSVLAYTSDAQSELAVPEWGTGPTPTEFATSSVFVWDLTNPDPTTSVSRVTPGSASAGSKDPALSGDGLVVAFVSEDPDLVPGAELPACNPECVPQVYLLDRLSGTLALGSRVPGDPAGTPVGADAAATQPALNDTGDELVYITRAGNLFATRSGVVGGPSDGDVVLAVPAAGTAQRVSLLADGITPAPAANSHPRLSGDGRIVVFDTLAGAAFGEPVLDGRQVVVVAHPPTLHLADLDMGTVAVGYPGPEWFLVVANNGPSSFVPGKVEVDQPDFLISGGSCVDDAGTLVPPGGSCTVNLMFMPSREGPQTATLTVGEAGFAPVQVSSQLTGRGGEPALAPNPAGADGGSLVVGDHGQPMIFEVQNVAFNPVRIASAVVQGANPLDFTITTDGCTARSIDADKSCTIETQFTPTGAGRRTASLVVSTDDGAYTTMLLSGDAHYEPHIAVADPTIVAGSRVTVVGAGFAPLTEVAVTWADGLGHPVTAATDWTGTLHVDLVVSLTERQGPRTLVGLSADGSAASVDVLILAPPRRVSPGSATWPGR